MVAMVAVSAMPAFAAANQDEASCVGWAASMSRGTTISFAAHYKGGFACVTARGGNPVAPPVGPDELCC
jgi:hypothetical protein